MRLLNYSTSVPVEKTLAEIMRRLAAHGAVQVHVKYGEGGVPEGLAFRAPTALGEQTYLLPANLSAVERTLAVQYRARKVPRSCASREQAARVAWRIIKDWIEAQLAIVSSGMVDLAEVMLPYEIGAGGKTVYEEMREKQLALPGGRG